MKGASILRQAQDERGFRMPHSPTPLRLSLSKPARNAGAKA